MTTSSSALLLAAAMFLTPSLSGQGAVADEPMGPFFPVMAIEDLKETRARPLFEPARRPFEPPQAAPLEEPVSAALQPPPPPPPPQPPAIRLLGLMVGDAGKLALIEHEPTGERVTLASGAVLDAWVMRVVDPRTVVFEHDGRQVEFALFDH